MAYRLFLMKYKHGVREKHLSQVNNEYQMARRRIRRVTMGKDAIKKSGTLIAGSIGPSSAITAVTLITTPLGRSSDGTVQTIREDQDTSNICNVGDICKYINIHLQCGARDSVEPEDDTSGWLEWGVVKYKEGLINPSNTNLGIQTLGDVLTQTFRGDCLMTGNFPVGGDIPNSIEIVVPVPKQNVKQQLGSRIVIYLHYVSVNNASVAVDLASLRVSWNYKLYV